MKTIMHAFFVTLAFLMLSASLLASIATLFFYPTEIFFMWKEMMGRLFWMFLVTLSLVGLLGFSLSKGRTEAIIKDKLIRMAWILIIGIFILWPCSYFLRVQMESPEIKQVIYYVQSIELLFDCIVLYLMILNFRDGSKLVMSGLG